MLDAQGPFQIEHPQTAVDHLDERGKLVVGENHLPLLRLHDQRQFSFPKTPRGPGESHRLFRSPSGTAHGGARHLLHRPTLIFGEQFDHHLPVGQSIEPHAPSHLQCIFQIDRLSHCQIRHDCVAALAGATQLPEGDAPQRHRRIPHLARRRLRREIAGRVGVLGAVGEHDDSGQIAAGDRTHAVVNGGADGRLFGADGLLPGAQGEGIGGCCRDGMHGPVKPPHRHISVAF